MGTGTSIATSLMAGPSGVATAWNVWAVAVPENPALYANSVRRSKRWRFLSEPAE
jgi:hypothetical protein